MENEIQPNTPMVSPLPPVQPTVTSSLPPQENILPTSKKMIIIGFAIILFLILLITSLVLAQKKLEVDIPSKKSPPVSQVTPTATLTNNTNAECAEFPDKLEKCISYTCKFTHPLSGEILTKEVKGIIGDKCNYAEGMPNKGKMECNYEQGQLKVMASYYRDLNKAESFGTDISSDLTEEKTKVTYTINGKEVSNPLQESLDSGVCVVSGY